jgi:hypothetical protein
MAFLILDLPRMLIRDRPPRSAPRLLLRPGHGYKTRKPDSPKTRTVNRELILELLPEY